MEAYHGGVNGSGKVILADRMAPVAPQAEGSWAGSMPVGSASIGLACTTSNLISNLSTVKKNLAAREYFADHRPSQACFPDIYSAGSHILVFAPTTGVPIIISNTLVLKIPCINNDDTAISHITVAVPDARTN